jgi:FMN phosphatase YigB (HAD superfamily)
MKPHREIYDHAVQRTGLPATEVFFVDDKPENVAGAVAAGMDAVLFTTVPQLEADLRQRGVTLDGK